VKGKKRGAEAHRHVLAEEAVHERLIVALKSAKVIPSSTASPSSCSKAGAWLASNGSRR
jgi:hypothetical protein